EAVGGLAERPRPRARDLEIAVRKRRAEGFGEPLRFLRQERVAQFFVFKIDVFAADDRAVVGGGAQIGIRTRRRPDQATLVPSAEIGERLRRDGERALERADFAPQIFFRFVGGG